MATFTPLRYDEAGAVERYLDGRTLNLSLWKKDVSYESCNFPGRKDMSFKLELALVQLLEVKHLFYERVDEMEHIDRQLTVINRFLQNRPNFAYQLLKTPDDQRHEHDDRMDRSSQLVADCRCEILPLLILLILLICLLLENLGRELF